MVCDSLSEVDLTGHHYTVKASTSDEAQLLKGINGVVEAGRMSAPHKSSGAGMSGLFHVLWDILPSCYTNFPVLVLHLSF
jgi:hypothetical protein